MNQENLQCVEHGIIPGFYRLNFRGMTIRECWWFGGWTGFYLALFYKLIGEKNTGCLWLPENQSTLRCEAADLSIHAQNEIIPILPNLAYRGFAPGAFEKFQPPPHGYMTSIGFAYHALSHDGTLLFSALHAHVIIADPLIPMESKVFVLVGAAVKNDGVRILVTNGKKSFESETPANRFFVTTKQIDSFLDKVGFIVAQNAPSLKKFPSLDIAMTDASHFANQQWAARIRRGLYERIG